MKKMFNYHFFQCAWHYRYIFFPSAGKEWRPYFKAHVEWQDVHQFWEYDPCIASLPVKPLLQIRDGVHWCRCHTFIVVCNILCQKNLQRAISLFLNPGKEMVEVNAKKETFFILWMFRVRITSNAIFRAAIMVIDLLLKV